MLSHPVLPAGSVQRAPEVETGAAMGVGLEGASLLEEASSKPAVIATAVKAFREPVLRFSYSVMGSRTKFSPHAVEPVESPESSASEETLVAVHGEAGTDTTLVGLGSSVAVQHVFEELKASQPRTAELCSGTARYSLHLQRAGAEVTAIDKAQNPHKTCVQVIPFDLSTPQGQAPVWQMVLAGEVDYVHASPPCGTASRAREKRISRKMQKKGAADPKPLRSVERPEGLCSLSGVDRLRVSTANRIYNFLAALFTLCNELKIPWSCENPLNSYLWLMRSWVKLLKDHCVFACEYDGCALGGLRKKRSVWYTTLPELRGLCRSCSEAPPHQHASWAPYQERGIWKFPSASEAEYPDLLCAVAAKCVLSHWPSVERGNSPEDEHAKITKSSVNIQPRGAHHPVVPEHKSVVVLNSHHRPACKLNELAPAMEGLPCAGCKLLRLSDVGGYGTGNDMEFQTAWGVPWSCAEFVDMACAAKHPMLENRGIDEITAKAIRDSLVTGPAETAKRRFSELMKWRTLAAELQEREDLLHQGMDEHQREVLSGKKLLLFQELLNRIGHVSCRAD